MQRHLYHLHALSALHCGTGQSAGIVDLPIARDRATQLPLVPGSSLRGVLREVFHNDPASQSLETVLFGPRSKGDDDVLHAGALAMGDAHLLLLPIRALAGIVAYATCPFILKRYAKDIENPPSVPQVTDTEARHANQNVNQIGNKVVLEDLDLTPHRCAATEAWATRIAAAIFPEGKPEDTDAQTDLKQRFLILSDSVFSFLAETATEIRARIAIDANTGVVKKGALWYEENLPAETVLWGIYALSDSRAKDRQDKAAELAQKIPQRLLLQLGGKAGVGRGLTDFINGGAK
jgi:CRISPR-associated protein Cmr4